MMLSSFQKVKRFPLLLLLSSLTNHSESSIDMCLLYLSPKREFEMGKVSFLSIPSLDA